MKKKKEVILHIDTRDNKKVNVSLAVNGKKISKTVPNSWTSQSLLPSIDKLLGENKIKPESLTEIRVNTGPGSYTGIRVGIAVANALAYLLKIPVNGEKNHVVSPIY